MKVILMIKSIYLEDILVDVDVIDVDSSVEGEHHHLRHLLTLYVTWSK